LKIEQYLTFILIIKVYLIYQLAYRTGKLKAGEFDLSKELTAHYQQFYQWSDVFIYALANFPQRSEERFYQWDDVLSSRGYLTRASESFTAERPP